MSPHPTSSDRTAPSFWLVILFSSMAGGMAWGIRGQYGHETGAMISGVLVGLVLVMMFCAHATSLFAARAVAMCALGVSIGGSMTYGQTIGLTHDAELAGNVEALRWGLLGLFVKGGIWIGLAAAFLAMALSETRYRPVELALVLFSLIFVYFLGVGILNEPFDPANKALPNIYFSDDWNWEHHRDLKPRREVWGGLLYALVGLYVYAGWFRGDRLVRRLTLWGLVAGGVGFAGGQCIQAFHPQIMELFRGDEAGNAGPPINWWNMMETAFGAIFGAILGLGLWLNRHLIVPTDDPGARELTPLAEWLLVAVHVSAVAVWNFCAYTFFDHFADRAITMVVIPVVAVAAGRLWPYLVALPIVAFPIAGKTLRELCYPEAPGAVAEVAASIGWIVYFVVPVGVMSIAAILLARKATTQGSARSFARWSLFLTTWLYFILNFAFFRYPWPWKPVSEWTGRTPNGLIFLVCAVGLTVAVLIAPRPSSQGGTKGQRRDEPEG